MRKGGYQIIDLGGVNLGTANSPAKPTIAGIYEKLEGTTKAIMLSGIVIDNVEQKDRYCTVNVNDSSYVLTDCVYTYTINADGQVTLGNV